VTDSTQRFTERAVDYAAHRPGYPAEVIDAILAGLVNPRDLVAADVGAGTGISASALADRGVRVIAIEPNDAMRAASQPNPLIEWRDGNGEATGLAGKSVDLACAFQAFHWFATRAAMQELARIARRRVAIAQYERDETNAASRRLAELYRAYALDDTEMRRLHALEVFADFPGAHVRHHVFRWERALDLESMMGMAASSSYLPREGAKADDLRSDLRNLFDTYAVGGRVAIRMQTFVFCADL
jgi:ubiquinone/menaquinone biosynthesis C-methylase UbiE